jgi:hypothetical protein
MAVMTGGTLAGSGWVYSETSEGFRRTTRCTGFMGLVFIMLGLNVIRIETAFSL